MGLSVECSFGVVTGGVWLYVDQVTCDKGAIVKAALFAALGWDGEVFYCIYEKGHVGGEDCQFGHLPVPIEILYIWDTRATVVCWSWVPLTAYCMDQMR
eukprot:3253568-Ditylum_brightwellii.AAC.1